MPLYPVAFDTILYQQDCTPSESQGSEYERRKASMLNELLLNNSRSNSTRHKVIAASAVSLVSILAFVLMYFYLSSRSPPTSTTPAASIDHTEECGRSAHEAIKRGCTFDQLSMLWLPPQASRLGTAQFLEQGLEQNRPGGWKYWYDREGTKPITNISIHTDIYWTTQREHLAHCAYHFLKVSDALRRTVLYEWKTYQQEHNMHCALMLLNASMLAPSANIDFIGTSSYVGFGSAVPMDW